MSIEEGKVSEDLEDIKSARAAAKGRVTRKINLLEGILLRDKNGKFVTAEINGNIAQDYKADIEAYHECFLDLHDRYMAYRAKEDDCSQK